MDEILEPGATSALVESRSGDDQEPLTNQARTMLLARFRQAGLDTAEAEDLAQECLVDILERMDRYDNAKGPMEAWISGFARNAIRSWYRRESSRKQAETSLDNLGDVAHPTESSSPIDAIQHGLGELNLVDRELMYMRFSLGMSFEDIARSTDLTAMNCRKRVSRAVERLRRDPGVREALGL